MQGFCQQNLKEFYIPPPSKRNYTRVDSDTSKWMLYRIVYNNPLEYNYYRIISFGLADDSGWSDAVNHIQKDYKKDTYLYSWCKTTDTIPQPIICYSMSENKNKADTSYFVGGIFGERIR